MHLADSSPCPGRKGPRFSLSLGDCLAAPSPPAAHQGSFPGRVAQV